MANVWKLIRGLKTAVVWSCNVVAILVAIGVVRDYVSWVEFEQRPAPVLSGPAFKEELKRFLTSAHQYTGWRGVARLQDKTLEPLTIQYGEVLGADQHTWIASLSKQFTAAAILKLEDQGKLRIQDPACLHLAVFCAESLKQITIEMLMSHTAGLAGAANSIPVTVFHLFSEVLPSSRFFASGLESRIELALRGDLGSVPGSKFRYSNLGYESLSHLIEKVTGRSFDEAMDALLFQPAGLGATRAVVRGGELPAGIPKAEISFGGWYIPVGSFGLRLDGSYGAGSIISSVGDLTKWAQALLSGKVFSLAQRQQLFTVRRDGYALGWVVDKHTLSGEPVVWHNGRTMGYFGELFLYPDQEVSIALLSALHYAGGDDQRVVTALQNFLRGKPYEVPIRRRWIPTLVF